MSKSAVFTNSAPKAVGPYSQGVRCGNLIFTAGQAALDPNTQQLISGGIAEQTRRTLENLKAALGGEQQEIDSLYPAFLVHATSQLDTHAMRSFQWAMEAERTHARLYEDAVATALSGRGWTQEQLDFYVCTLCGYTAKTQEADNCPACNFVWERFEVIR